MVPLEHTWGGRGHGGSREIEIAIPAVAVEITVEIAGGGWSQGMTSDTVTIIRSIIGASKLVLKALLVCRPYLLQLFLSPIIFLTEGEKHLHTLNPSIEEEGVESEIFPILKRSIEGEGVEPEIFQNLNTSIERGDGVGDLSEFEYFNRERGDRVGDLSEFEYFNRGRGDEDRDGDLLEFEYFNRGRGGGAGDLSEFELFNRGRGGEDTEQFMPNRGREGEYDLNIEQHLTPPPSFYTADYSRSTMEVLEDTLNDHGYSENNLLGSRGTRVPSGTPKKENTNVASRIQSGKSIWERIEERPTFLPNTRGHQLETNFDTCVLKVCCILQKTYKHPKCSLVWTLSGETPNEKRVSSSNRWKVLPHLLPWKRTIYSRNFNRNNTIMPRRSLSLFSKKLQHTRMRNTIYKVSTDGFTLRKAGLVSIGGSSLKWSKSIEKHSKNASKEATLAVAEAERKKRETPVTRSVGAKGKGGRGLPRERIFRVGSARYKMEASRRTLVRIPDERSSSVADVKSGNNSQTPFVPRRLLIGNDEYIRVGNGNKLVRDPKKLVRILATEKVRWSLHTARLRLAKKQQYCQFFTRFGKCNKNGGKCPYIHDPAKIAICTKFVRGLCSNANCKLTHKVLPERMPDCSYYLQALCTNINCPYRHVHVNPKASVCDDFLRGYCAAGDECLKKHSYVCPTFEATGKCPEGSKCKLHHPKPKSKPKKKKLPIVQSSSHMRYFGSSVLEAGEPLIAAASDRHVMENVGDFFYSDGQFTDYIPLDIPNEGDVEVDGLTGFEQILCDSELSEMQENDIDALIKPVLIMKADPCG